jgi:hypothetical protein
VRALFAIIAAVSRGSRGETEKKYNNVILAAKAPTKREKGSLGGATCVRIRESKNRSRARATLLLEKETKLRVRFDWSECACVRETHLAFESFLCVSFHYLHRYYRHFVI